MYLKASAVTILFTLVCSVADGQPRCKVRTFGTEDGLPAGFISGITQSTDDLLWISSWNGLTCFDGYRFTTFRSIPGKNLLPTNHLKYLVSGIQGNLWTETYTNDIFLFDSRKCSFEKINPVLPVGRDASGTAKPFRLRKIYPLENGHSWLAGKDVDHFRVTDSLLSVSDNAIEHFRLAGILNKVTLDKAGNEWCFTTKGVYLNGTTKLSDEPFDYVLEVGGALWFVSPRGRLGCLHGSKIVMANLQNTVSGINECAVVRGNVIALATDAGVLLYNVRDGSERLVSIQTPSNPVASVKQMFRDSHDRLWCFNDGPGVTMVEVATGAHLWLDAQLPNDLWETGSECALFHEDKRKTVWVVPTGGTFAYYDAQKRCLVPHPLRPSYSNSKYVSRIRRYYSDVQGNLWLGCLHNISLVNFYHNNVERVERNDANDTRAILQLPSADGNIVTGSYDGKFMVYDSRLNLLSQERIASNVYALHYDRKGRLWIGTKGDGLIMRDASGGQTVFLHDGADQYSISHNRIYDIKEDSRGRILVATYGGGLNIIDEAADGGRIRFIHSGNVLKGFDTEQFKEIRRITVTREGYVLLASNTGLVTFSDRFSDYRKVKFYVSRHLDDVPASLFSSQVMQCCATQDGRVYVATIGGGLQQAASKDVLRDNIRFTGVDTHSIQTILALVADNSDDLWIIGESRISRLDHKTNVIQEFGAEELGDVTMSEALPCHNAAGDRILVGTEGGFLSFLPRMMLKSSYQPTVVFTSINYPDNLAPLPILNTERLYVDVDKRTFTVFFSALDYTDNRNIRYAYMLDGDPHNEKQRWLYTREGTNSVTFNGFPAGSHTLYVRSTNSDGVWMDNTRALHIYAQPTFMESWWGQLIMLVLVSGAIAYAIYYYMRRKKVEIQEEATEQAEAGKVRFLLQKPEIIDEDKETMDRILKYVEEHLDNTDLKVDDLAHSLNIGRSALYARIKRIADMTPNDFIRHVRMQRAEDLVAESRLPMAQIAYKVGFADPKYFGKCFKKHTGMSPSEFRQYHAEKAAVAENEAETEA